MITKNKRNTLRYALLLITPALFCFILNVSLLDAATTARHSEKIISDVSSPEQNLTADPASSTQILPGLSGEHSLAAEGTASYYGKKFQGRKTASGESFNGNHFTAAHRSLPFGTSVRVTNLDNGKNVVVRINDRGPHVKRRIIDVSPAAAREIGLYGEGTANVRIEAFN
ncbi:MAG: septal ring lytic transglycosylase RlpA family protein [Chlorobiaceae bacterium]|nr:septal ring lytic transglycosylase RlpA family protein [Chlorobiaceae bacterium]